MPREHFKAAPAARAALGAALLRLRQAMATGRRMPAALYDGYVGAYAEFHRNEYRDAAARRG